MKRLGILLTFFVAALIGGCNFPIFENAPAPGGQIVAYAMGANPTVTLTLPPVHTLTPFQPATLAPTFTLAPTQTQIPSLTPIPTNTNTPIATKTPRLVLSRGDLHVHTKCSDGHNPYDEVIAAAVERDYQFIAITDHHVCPEVIQACQNEERILCFPGQEIASLERLEILSIGTTRQYPDYLTLRQISDLVHEWGGMAIAAHPWSLEGTWTERQILNSHLDAMECRRYGERTMPFDTSSLPCTYDSDSHDISTLYDPMVCIGTIRNLADLKNAILTGQCLPPYVSP